MSLAVDVDTVVGLPEPGADGVGYLGSPPAANETTPSYDPSAQVASRCGLKVHPAPASR